MPGRLLPVDLPRIHQAVAPDLSEQAFAKTYLLASHGARPVSDTGLAIQVGTIVPARGSAGSCIFLKHDRCSIHAVSPFDCAFTSSHQTKREIEATVAAYYGVLISDYLAGGPYTMLWRWLDRIGRRVEGPAIRSAVPQLFALKEETRP